MEGMPYAELVGYYHRLESTTKRLEMTDILIELFKKCRGEDIQRVVFLTQGILAPEYEGVQLGLADKLIIKALGECTGIKEGTVRRHMTETGDLGEVARIVVSGKGQTTLSSFMDGDDDTEELTVDRVFSDLLKIADPDKHSQDRKLKLLSGLLHDSMPDEAKYITRTAIGKLRLGVGDMTIIDALAYAFEPDWSMITAEVKEELDIINSMVTRSRTKGKRMETIDTSLEEVNRRLPELVDRTTEPLYSVLDATEKARKAAVGIWEGKTVDGPVDRITSLHDKLTSLKSGIESNRSYIEGKYNIHPNLGHLARTLSQHGMDGLETINMEPGIPMRSMLAERLSSAGDILEKLGGKCAFEYKYDGLRIQAHVKGKEINLFSRRLENVTAQFPDVVSYLARAVPGREVIVEGECVPVDPSTGEMLPFQVVSHRRGRKYDLEKMQKEVPVVLYLFDCLYLDGRSVMERDYLSRREMLQSLFPGEDQIRLSRSMITSSKKDAEAFFLRAIDDGCEGLIGKSIADDSRYRAGARGWQWIKYKRDYQSRISDTIDLVVVGGYSGRGRRAGVMGAFLMAVYDRNTGMFQSVCKLGSGFSDDQLSELTEALNPYRTQQKPDNLDATMVPEFWLEPRMVLEVRGAEITVSPVHTCAMDAVRKDSGLAVRFPRFTGRIRDDKGPADATTSEELLNMYRSQLKTIKK